MERAKLIDFVRSRGLGVVASRGPDDEPQAALVGIAVTDRGELIFDCSRDSRTCINIQRHPEVALVVGWEDEVTVQIQGVADVLTGGELRRCAEAYFEQHRGGRERAASPEIVHVRVTPRWLRYSDFRPESRAIAEARF